MKVFIIMTHILAIDLSKFSIILTPIIIVAKDTSVLYKPM